MFSTKSNINSINTFFLLKFPFTYIYLLLLEFLALVTYEHIS